MSFTDNLVLWAFVIWLPWLMYAMLRNEARPKKNIIVGVTIPPDSQNDEEVLAITKKYKSELLWITVLCMIPAIPCMLIKSMGLSMTIWMIWLLGVCFVGYVPYVRCNKALHRLKEARGWKKQGSGKIQVDLKAAAVEMKWLSPVAFLPPALISLIPIFFEPELWPLWVTLSATVGLFYIFYRYCYRNKAEMVDGNTDRTIALTRIRRYNWGKTWLLFAWATGILNPMIWLMEDYTGLSMAVFLIYMVVILWAGLSIEFRVRAQQEKLCAGSMEEFYVDEDDCWIWGMFYYNPNDSRLVINSRVGMNSTINLAKRSGQVIMGITGVILLACAFIGVFIMDMENTAVEMSMTDEAIVGSHYWTEYSVPLEEIERVELVEELPDMRRMFGTGMPGLCSGKWSSSEWGRFTCCIDPRVGPWLLLETESGGRYLFGGGVNGDAAQMFGMLS